MTSTSYKNLTKVWKVIRISEDNYNRIAEHGHFKQSFDSVLGDIIEKAEFVGGSVVSVKKEEED